MARNGYNKFEVTTKLYVANLPETCKKSDLQGLFEQFGTVAECDIVKNYAFVHFDSPDDAQSAVAALDDSEFQGMNISVQLSRSKVRQKPGMGNQNECYRCGKDGHWSKDCPKYPSRGRDDDRGRGRDDRGRGRGRGRGGGRDAGRDHDDYPPPRPYGRDPYARDPYGRDPYDDPYYDYYRRPYPPPPDRHRPYDPYARPRRPLPPADPYYDRDPDPYARPPPDYYRRSPPPRDPYAARDPYDPYGKPDPYGRPDPYSRRPSSYPPPAERGAPGKAPPATTAYPKPY